MSKKKRELQNKIWKYFSSAHSEGVSLISNFMKLKVPEETRIEKLKALLESIFYDDEELLKKIREKQSLEKIFKLLPKGEQGKRKIRRHINTSTTNKEGPINTTKSIKVIYTPVGGKVK